MVLAIAPNGARKTTKDHPALPITPEELAQTAVACLNAGARMMHVHVRNDNQQHCLDAKRYQQAFTAIRERVGQQLLLQATTEAVEQYQPQQQMDIVSELADLQRGLGIFGVSIAVREILSTDVSDTRIHDFFLRLKNASILPQLIIYDPVDKRRFQQLLADGVLPGKAYPCLFVLGRYHQQQQVNPAELIPFFNDLSGVSTWMGCAFGAREADVALVAALLGGHMRIGYENNSLLANGSVSNNNAELIQQTAKQLATTQRCLPTPEETIHLMTPDW